MSETITLTVGGREYRGWTQMLVSRGIDRCASHFEISVTERWAGQSETWRMLPFDPAVVKIGPDVVLTGYVDEYEPQFSATMHVVRIIGRSRTEDLIDCKPDIAGGQFTGYSLAAVSRAVAEPFGIPVVVQTALAEAPLVNPQMQRNETAFTFLERLGRMAGVLLTDDEEGELVLTTAGAVRATGRVLQGPGGNVQQARAVISGSHRFSEYIVKGQAGLRVAASVQNGLEAVAHDAGVPRFRPLVQVGATQATAAELQGRANWLASYNAGRATQATITVSGWRQTPGGRLWAINQVVAVTCDWLGIDDDLLVAAVQFELNAGLGAVTLLTVGPVAGYTPNPAEVKLRHHGHRGHGKGRGGGINWSGLGGIP